MNSCVKQWCYNSTCGPFVETGWLTQYLVCRLCKTEVTPELKERVEARMNPAPTPDATDDEDLFKLWSGI